MQQHMENKNNSYGRLTASDTLRLERILPGTTEIVWAYITESERRARWLASGEMELWPGGNVALHFYHNDLSPLPGTIPDKYKSMENGADLKGKVLACEPPHLLSFTWGDGSEVTFELTGLQQGVLVVITHRKLKQDKASLLSVSSGWHTHMAILLAYLEGETPDNFWQLHAALEGEYEREL